MLSSVWGIGHVGLPFSERGHIQIFGLELPLAEDTTFVASLRYVGSIHLRVEEIAGSEAEATKTTQTLGLLLGAMRTLEGMRQGPVEDAELKRALDSLKVEQRRDRAVVTATIPLELAKRISGTDPISQR